MKISAWTIYVTVVVVVSFPLAFLTFYFSEDPRFGWISTLSFAAGVVLGLVGGIRGFMKYFLKERFQKRK